MKLVSPLQEVIEVEGSLEQFAKTNHLDFYKLMQLIEGYNNTNCYLGWKSYDRVDKVIDPDGNIVEILGSKVDFAKEHGISPTAVTILTKHKRAYKGWQPYFEESVNV